MGKGAFLHGGDRAGDPDNSRCRLFRRSAHLHMAHHFGNRIGWSGELSALQLGVGFPFFPGTVRKPAVYQFFCLLLVDGVLPRDFLLEGHARKQAELQHAKLNTGFLLDFFLELFCKIRKSLVGHDMEDVDILVFHPLAVLVDTQAQAAAIFWRQVKVDFWSIKVQTWNTLGLSQPSFSAE